MEAQNTIIGTNYKTTDAAGVTSCPKAAADPVFLTVGALIITAGSQRVGPS